MERYRWLVITASVVVIIAGIKAAEEIVVPFLLAIFFATISATPVFWLNRHRVPIWLAISMVVAAIIFVLSGIGAVVAGSVQQFRQNIPVYEERLSEVTAKVAAVAERYGYPLDSIRDQIEPARALELVGNTLVGFGSTLGNSFFILLTVIFILAEASSFPRKLRDVLSAPERDMPHFERFAVNVNRYIGIKTTVSVGTGLLVGVSLAIIGVDFPFLWGLLAFMLNYIPNIGSLIAAVPAVIFAFIQLGLVPCIATGMVYAVVNVVMGNVVEPRFMGKGLGLSTLVVFISLVFWNWMLGPVGMLLSVPLTMTVKIALEANPSTIWMAHLLAPSEEIPLEQGPGANQQGQAVDEREQEPT